MKNILKFVLLMAAALVVAVSGPAVQGVRQILAAAPVEPVQNEPPAKLVIDPPLAESLSHGRVVIQYRAEHLHLVPVFGPAALAVSPRIGHLHVTVDDTPWVWADASGEPLILNGLPSGPHQVRIQLETANHQQLDQGTVRFKVPRGPMAPAAKPPQTNQAVKFVVDPPVAGALSRGVVIIPYRAENLQLVPVFGPAALAIAPPVGHIHVTVDDTPWHWADASGNPVIVQGLPPGPHKILIQLENANHQPIDQSEVRVTVPAGALH